MNDLTNLMSPGRAARELGISSERVRQLIRSGRLRAERTELGALIHPDDVERLRLERAARRGGSRPGNGAV